MQHGLPVAGVARLITQVFQAPLKLSVFVGYPDDPAPAFPEIAK
jgi:hypothetical protein